MKKCLKNHTFLLTYKTHDDIFEVSNKDTGGDEVINKRELEAEMKRFGDTGGSLAEYLGIARGTFSAKINETNGAEFTQGEIAKIKERYSLGPEALILIFFNEKVS